VHPLVLLLHQQNLWMNQFQQQKKEEVPRRNLVALVLVLVLLPNHQKNLQLRKKSSSSKKKGASSKKKGSSSKKKGSSKKTTGRKRKASASRSRSRSKSASRSGAAAAASKSRSRSRSQSKSRSARAKSRSQSKSRSRSRSASPAAAKAPAAKKQKKEAAPKKAAAAADSSPVDAEVSAMSNDQLKERLKANDQITSGNKGDLVKRVKDCVANGCLPRCPQCSGGRLKKTGAKYTCPGYHGDTHFHKCSYEAASVTRPAWVPAAGKNV